MRILHVVTAFPRSADDVISPWLVEMLRRLRERGIDVEVFTSSYLGAGDQTYEGIPVHRYRYFIRRWENLTHEETAPDRMKRSLLYKVMPLFYVAFGMVAAFRRCLRERYDIVHVHWPLPLALFGWAARRACGARIVTTFYGIELRWVARSLPFLSFFLRWAIRQSARVVAISSYTAGEVRRLTNRNIDVIPYTGALPPPLEDPRDPLNGRGFRVLFVGRLIERKGVDVLVRALARVPLELSPSLEIIGSGPERERLEGIVREVGLTDRVVFRGKVSNGALARAYASSSVFVLPSKVDSRGDTEGLGVVLLEAMNYAVPVVASASGGITDIVRDRQTGLLVPPNDIGALASALESLARDQGLARELGRKGQAHLRSSFTWDSIIDRWVSLYTEVMAIP